MDKNSFFWLGGIGSLVFYATVIAILIFTITTSQNLKKIAIKSEQSSIEVSMEELEAATEPTPKDEKKQEPQQEIAKQEESKKPEPKKPEKIIEDAISPKKIIKEVVKKEAPKPTTTQTTTQTKNTPTEQPKSAKDLLASLSIKKNSDISFTAFNSSGEVNEYLSNIAKIIKQGWNPAKTDAGIIAIVVVDIESNGSFSFRLKRGGSADFNDRLMAYLQFLQKKGFPPPSDKKAVSVEFNFKARE